MGLFGKIMSGVNSVIGIGSSVAQNKANKYAVDQTNKTNLQIAQMNNEWSEKMLDKQQRYNIDNFGMQTDFSREMYDKQTKNQWDMFNATNEYNSASSQRERLEQAGLNPYLMMNGGSAGTASAVGGTSAQGSSPGSVGLPSPSQVQMQAPQYDFSGITNSITSGLDMFNQIANSDSQRDLLRQQADQLRIENRYRVQKEMQGLMNVAADTKNKEAVAKLNQTLNKLNEINSKYADDLNIQELARRKQEIQNMKATYDSVVSQTLLNNKALNSYDERFRMEMAETASRIALQRAQRDLTTEQALHEVKNRLLTQAQITGQYLSNKLAEQQAEALLGQAIETWNKLRYEAEHARNNRGADGYYGLPNIIQVGAQEAGKAIKEIYGFAKKSAQDAADKKVHEARIRY